jgi:hypothetical protein
VLAHELNHARNNALGNNQQLVRSNDPAWNQCNWTNREEAATVGVENSYRAERGGVPQRADYQRPALTPSAYEVTPMQLSRPASSPPT